MGRRKTASCERVAQLRPLFQPADVPLGWGQAARPPVLVMVSGYSRMIAAVMIPTRAAPDLLAGHWHLISGQARRVYGGGGGWLPSRQSGGETTGWTVTLTTGAGAG